MMLVNAFSPVRLIEIFEDVVAPNGTVAVMSSELGSVTNNDGAWDLYASTKAALNMLMKCYSAHRPDDRRAKLVVAPGWIQTDMGGSGATFTIEECIPLRRAEAADPHSGAANPCNRLPCQEKGSRLRSPPPRSFAIRANSILLAPAVQLIKLAGRAPPLFGRLLLLGEERLIF